MSQRAGGRSIKLPRESVAEDCFPVAADFAFLRAEVAADSGRNAQQRQECRCGGHGGNALRSALDLDGQAGSLEHGLGFERRDVADPVVVVRDAAVVAVHRSRLGILIPHDQNAPRFGHRQRLEEHGMHHGEGGRIGGDTDRERDEHGQTESFIAEQRAESVLDIAEQGIIESHVFDTSRVLASSGKIRREQGIGERIAMARSSGLVHSGCSLAVPKSPREE